MAIFNPGPVVGQISGRIGGTVFSHNRGGAYIRNGAIPYAVYSQRALTAKSALSLSVRAWSNLTEAQRLSWQEYAKTITATNGLGKQISLTGQNCYVRSNARLIQALETPVDTPPTAPAPDGVAITSFAVDAGAGDTELVFAPTPLPAGHRMWIRACRTTSGAITNFQNLLTTVLITPAAATSPVDLKPYLIDAFGALEAGMFYHVEIRVFSTATGLMSAPFYASTEAVST